VKFLEDDYKGVHRSHRMNADMPSISNGQNVGSGWAEWDSDISPTHISPDICPSRTIPPSFYML